jgi:hypothetical protein
VSFPGSRQCPHLIFHALGSLHKSFVEPALVRATGLPSGTLAGRSYPLLAITAPKNDPKARALGDYLISALGSPIRGRWSERKYQLMGLLVRFGVECVRIERMVVGCHDRDALASVPLEAGSPGIPSLAQLTPSARKQARESKEQSAPPPAMLPQNTRTASSRL